MNEATQRQNMAAEPRFSTWLSANAGSGKTRVLTDRVARLLLDGVEPQSILCLTYTKAAASEMQNRLFRRLGDWSMRPDQELSKELATLGVEGVANPALLADARRLFARAIETPGGLRIQTIHSFCASLLRRFPLEAGVSPSFAEMDDRSASLLRSEVLDDIAEGYGAESLSAILQQVSDDGLEGLTRTLITERDNLDINTQRADIMAWFGLADTHDIEFVLSTAFIGDEPSFMPDIIQALRNSKSSQDNKAAQKLSQITWENLDVIDLKQLFGIFLTGASAKAPFTAKIGAFPTKACQTTLGPMIDDLNALMQRVEDARQPLLAIEATDLTEKLYDFARVFLPRYAKAKEHRGWLDFDDLILKTRALLSNSTVAAWVLYKLDGGLDHILVDEAQDTSPEQWQVIELLAQEFTSGQGARDDVLRTIFVVGDKKQSIYSFQGADPREFDRMQAHFYDRLSETDNGLRTLNLEFSFRSSDAILRFVDQLLPISDTQHRAFHGEKPGRVDLWPPVPRAASPEKGNWFDPVDLTGESHHSVILARKIASEIRGLIENETIPAENGAFRNIRAGDIMILVRRRNELFDEIIRACKSEGLPIAGADRLRLGEELAVKDVVSLLKFIATPEDDLSLAEALRSPIFGWNEADLFDLAHARPQPYLWAELRSRAEEFPDTLEIINDLRKEADFLRPFDLIERIMSRHNGRENLLKRLGSEAEDGLDALLAQTLVYEQSEVPSLTGFLTWLSADDIEIKRQMDSAGDQIRVMTIHGAKGLEAPIVILPDTAKRILQIRHQILPIDGGGMGWRMENNAMPKALADSLEIRKAQQSDEDDRLLYVAATRAESWLIFAAAGDVTGSWFERAEQTMSELGATEFNAPTGTGLRFQHSEWGKTKADFEEKTLEPFNLPDWISEKAEQEPRPKQTRAPSGLGGAKAIWQDREGDPDAMAFGTAVHLLLEKLPGLPAQSWQSRSRQMLRDLTEDEVNAAFAEAKGVLLNDALAHLFEPNTFAEVEITANLNTLGGERISGAIDRLIINDTHVLAVDYKTNAAIPDTANAIPEGLLRQLGAYQGALEQIYPSKDVQTAILWTKTANLMLVPNNIVRDALSRATTS